MDEKSYPEENRENKEISGVIREDGNNTEIPGESAGIEKTVKKEAVSPTVEYLPDIVAEDIEDDAENGDSAANNPEKPEKSIPEKLKNGVYGDELYAGTGKTRVKKALPEKRRGIPVGVFISVLCLSVLVTFMFTYVLLNKSFQKVFTEYRLEVAERYGDLSGLFSKISAVDDSVRSQYLYDIDEETLEDSVLRGYLYGIGDKYAEYFNKEQMEQLIADSNAEMQGIGVTVIFDSETGAILVATVYPESPAEKAGVLPGDLIAYIKEDEEYVPVSEYGYTVALNKLRGKAGTLAQFGVFRNEDYSNMLEFSIERGFVTEITVTGEMSTIDPEAGIIRISSFDSKTPEQFKSVLDSLTEQGAKRLVFDVRNNPGGELDSICAVLDMLLPEGPVIRTVDKNGKEEIVYTSDKNEIKLPMAVITNGSTASAAELFTSALRDYEKATLVGEKTYGKGSMQTIQTFMDGTGFKYTYRYYCPPFSDNYDGVGISPDVEVMLSEQAQKKNVYLLSEQEDDQLKAALESFEK